MVILSLVQSGAGEQYFSYYGYSNNTLLIKIFQSPKVLNSFLSADLANGDAFLLEVDFKWNLYRRG